MPNAPQSVVIHGHFYQPPRDDPWLDEIEAEPTAAPYHDWNERIERECYRTVVAAHLTAGGQHNRIVGIVNTLEWISFNYGATLLEWLETNAPATYAATIAADKASVERLGFGNAIAQPYHHVILPLASRRDKLTEVRWGIADFKRRFGRDPLGMWLPETAMDHETLDVLAECGIRFTILAPHQVVTPPPNGMPGEYRAANGKSVALFMYDGDLAHAVAFGGALNNAGQWVKSMLRRPAAARAEGSASPRLVSIATDGETYGHHHKFGEMALARAITDLRERKGVTVENFASFLSRNPPTLKMQLVEPTSWSCAHGVERWRSNCGDRVNGAKYPSQEWRTPLRGGLDVLAAGIHALYEREGREYFDDPWAARDEYGTAVGASPNELEALVRRLAKGAGQLERARELLEMERDSLRMFSSCAWFFDDIGGLEPLQVLRYAAHACELAGARNPSIRSELESALLGYLEKAVSNDAVVGTGRDVYEKKLRSRPPADVRVAAGVAAAHALGLDAPAAAPRAYEASINQGAVELRVLRTGRTAHLQTEADALSEEPVDSAVRVSKPEAAGSDLIHLDDFPERARRMIRASLRHRLLASSLTPQELGALANGDASVRELAARALVRSIQDLPRDESGAALRRANAVLDLLAQLESPIPFDAQAAWWQVHARGDGRRAQIAALGARLGFDVSAAALSDGTTV
jgi:alpha-amylase/alpha-mannosidase (GH57 family)